MAKYRKKPVIVEAEQWWPSAHHKHHWTKDHLGVETLSETEGRIETLEGKMRVSPGDWIVTGIAGEKYPCKPDIFEATYEKVSE